MKKTILLFCLILASCSKSKQFLELPSYPHISKHEVLWPGGESTPIVFNDSLYYLSIGISKPYRLDVRNAQGQVLYSHESGLEYISAYNDNGTIYIVGSNADKSALLITSSTDLINWTAQREVISGQGNKYYNSSITKTDNGFVMAYEVCRDGITCFNVQFLHTVDFVNWQSIGSRTFDKQYTACPTLRYFSGVYYMTFTAHYISPIDFKSHWATLTARSTDLVDWQLGNYQLLTSKNGGELAPNASDIDYVDFNGIVEIIYLNTPQEPVIGKTFTNVGSRRATYNGTLEQLLKDQFN